MRQRHVVEEILLSGCCVSQIVGDLRTVPRSRFVRVVRLQVQVILITTVTRKSKQSVKPKDSSNMIAGQCSVEELASQDQQRKINIPTNIFGLESPCKPVCLTGTFCPIYIWFFVWPPLRPFCWRRIRGGRRGLPRGAACPTRTVLGSTCARARSSTHLEKTRTMCAFRIVFQRKENLSFRSRAWFSRKGHQYLLSTRSQNATMVHKTFALHG